MGKRNQMMVFLMFLLVLFISACGNNNGPEEEGIIIDDPVINDPVIIEGESGGVTLSILMPTALRRMVDHAVSEMEQVYELEVQITEYDGFEMPIDFLRLQTMLMAGEAYDIIFLDNNFPLIDYMESGFFADINYLIEQCTIFERSDFYETVLDMLTHRGTLTLFPLTFGFMHIGINANMPPSVVNRFTSLEAISVNEMFALYSTLIRDYPEFSNHHIGRCSYFFNEFRYLTQRQIANRVNFENMTANLADPGFVQYLETVLLAYQGTLNHLEQPQTNIGHPVLLEFLSHSDVFVVKGVRGFSTFSALTPIEGDYYFLHYIPLVDDYGGLITNLQQGYSSRSRMLMIGQTDNKYAAWQLIAQFLLPTLTQGALHDILAWGGYANGIGTQSSDIPIVRTMTQSVVTDAYTQAIVRNAIAMIPNNDITVISGGIQFADWSYGFHNPVVESGISQLEGLAERPLAPLHLIPWALVQQSFEMMLLQVISPDEAAQEMQNIISLWLMERG